MAVLLGYNQATPDAPAASQSTLFVDSNTLQVCTELASGKLVGILSRSNAVASQGAGFAADTYVTGSGLVIPVAGIQIGMLARWTITLSKTAAGTATPVFTIRLGTGVVGDTSVLALTGPAQTAAADSGTLIVTAQVRGPISASGVVAGAAHIAHAAAGGAGLGGGADGVSGSVDLTNAGAGGGKVLGLSMNGGASAAWTVTSVVGELIG